MTRRPMNSDSSLDLALFGCTHSASRHHLLLIPRASLLYHYPWEDRPSGKGEDDGRLSTNGCRNVLDVTRD